MHHPTEWLNTHDMHTAMVMPMIGIEHVHPLLLFSLLIRKPLYGFIEKYSKLNVDLQFKLSFFNLSHNMLR